MPFTHAFVDSSCALGCGNMYKNQASTPIAKPVLHPTSVSNGIDRNASRVELLWRKRSAKVHKSWEGDAIGTIVKGDSGRELLVDLNGRRLGRRKIQDADLAEGTILTIGGHEVEVGSSLSRTPKVQPSVTRSASTASHSMFSVPFPGFTGSVVSERPRAPIGSAKNGSTKRLKTECLRSHPDGPDGLSSSHAQPFVTNSSRTPEVQLTSEMQRSVLTRPMVSVLKTTREGENQPENASEEISPLLARKLRPHQAEAVRFICDSIVGTRHAHGNGCILADEMGLGKTLTSIAALHTLLARKVVRNALIVCPVSLVANWKLEFEKWLPVAERIVPQIGVMSVDQYGHGNGSLRNPAGAFFGDRSFRTHQVMIIGYERVRSLAIALQATGKKFDMVVCDEGHRLKSLLSKTRLALADIAEDRRVILTGTPIQNQLGEFYALADFVNPGVFGSEAKFNRKFAMPLNQLLSTSGNNEDGDDAALGSIEGEPTASPSVAESKANEALSELTEICEEFMLRRTAAIIESYVGVPKTELIAFCRPTEQQATAYENLVNSASLLLGDTSLDGSACLRAISDLKKAAAGVSAQPGGKLAVLSKLLDVVSQDTTEKVVVVSGSTKVLDMCQHLCANKKLAWLRLDGTTPQEKRQSGVKLFNTLPRAQASVFLLSVRSGGIGLNLVGASRLVLMDTDWNPAIDAQAMARIHRDGQKKSCFIYRLLSTGTIDEKILQRQLSKLGLSENVLVDFGGGHKPDFSRETLRDLFTFTRPAKCNTLDCIDASLKGYEDVTQNVEDPVLCRVMAQTDISCVLKKSVIPAHAKCA